MLLLSFAFCFAVNHSFTPVLLCPHANVQSCRSLVGFCYIKLSPVPKPPPLLSLPPLMQSVPLQQHPCASTCSHVSSLCSSPNCCLYSCMGKVTHVLVVHPPSCLLQSNHQSHFPYAEGHMRVDHVHTSHTIIDTWIQIQTLTFHLEKGLVLISNHSGIINVFIHCIMFSHVVSVSFGYDYR